MSGLVVQTLVERTVECGLCAHLWLHEQHVPHGLTEAHVSLEVGLHSTRIKGIDSDGAVFAQPFGQFSCEENLSQFALGIGLVRVVSTVPQIDILEVNLSIDFMKTLRDIDYASSGRLLEDRE